MATTQKAFDILGYLQDDLKLRFPTLTFVQATAADGNPYFSAGTGVSQTANFVVKCKPMAVLTGVTDVLGNAAQVFCPTVIQLNTEANETAGAGPENFTSQQLISLLGEITKRHCLVEWYVSTFGTPPAIGEITGTPTATFKDLYWDFKKAS